MPVDRSSLAAVLRLAAPDAPSFEIDAAVDAAIGFLGGAVTTADRIAPPGPSALPQPAAGQARVEVIEASEREWPDSGLVLSLTLRLVDDPNGPEIRARFDASRAVARRIALDALGGLGDGEPLARLIGRQAIVETKPYTGRDGIERVGIAKWITPRKPGMASARRAAVRNRKPEASSLPDDDIPF